MGDAVVRRPGALLAPCRPPLGGAPVHGHTGLGLSGGRLLRDATARSLPLGLGFLLNGAGALVDTSGRASEQLYVLGAGRRGARWEAAAVPEIRDHATQLAPQLTGVAMDGGLSTGTAALSEGASAGA